MTTEGNEARVWDRLAGRYDRIVRLFDRSYDDIRDKLRADLDGSGRVLEVAAGTGQFTLTLAEVAAELVTTDVSPEMVTRLRDRIDKTALPNVSVAVMGAYELETDADSFDAVFCANALHVMEEPERALAEFRRVLRPSGLLVVPTFCHAIDRRRRLLSKALSVVSPFVAHHRFTPQTLGQLVEASGFTVSRREVLPGLFPIAYVVARPVTT